MSRLTWGLALALLLVACDQGEVAEKGAREAPAPSASSTPAQRTATPPRGPDVELRGSKRGRRGLRRSIADLRSIGVWRPLTGALEALRIEWVTGRDDIPADLHLADARVTLRRTYRFVQRFCEVSLYAAAIAGDLERQALYHAQGRLPAPPPGSVFRAAVLAHELTHCRPRSHGEASALEWERRTRARLET